MVASVPALRIPKVRLARGDERRVAQITRGPEERPQPGMLGECQHGVPVTIPGFELERFRLGDLQASQLRIPRPCRHRPGQIEQLIQRSPGSMGPGDQPPCSRRQREAHRQRGYGRRFEHGATGEKEDRREIACPPGQDCDAAHVGRRRRPSGFVRLELHVDSEVHLERGRGKIGDPHPTGEGVRLGDPRLESERQVVERPAFHARVVGQEPSHGRCGREAPRVGGVPPGEREEREQAHAAGPAAERGAQGERRRIAAGEVELPTLVVGIVRRAESRIGGQRQDVRIIGFEGPVTHDPIVRRRGPGGQRPVSHSQMAVDATSVWPEARGEGTVSPFLVSPLAGVEGHPWREEEVRRPRPADWSIGLERSLSAAPARHHFPAGDKACPSACLDARRPSRLSGRIGLLGKGAGQQGAEDLEAPWIQTAP